MRKRFLVLGIAFIFFKINAQVGINTTMPLHPFHVDAAQNNPFNTKPTDIEIKDDFVVTKEGRVGVGTIAPQATLEVNGSVRIVDGSEGKGKILMSDDSGLAKWEKVPYDIPTILGSFESMNNVAWNGTSVRQTFTESKYYIVLTKGRWIVNSGINIKISNNAVWLHTVLSTSKTAREQKGFSFTTLAGSQTANAAKLRVGNNGMLIGSSIINVTSDSVTLYLLIEKIGSWVFNPNNSQNYFYASPIL
ncbi:hypothetical protein LNQ81_13170 [Myroides sp. M-43]|uniref:hypothetical protein n=1 Tax=Myroides oncorhynchi TaxID=2893756 RepID=UPI001E47BABC|nr:hypothetical protein [Myroides oncorhynchi]MCC9043625.1 hypothetical protein [Myroides oncorhynchi]